MKIKRNLPTSSIRPVFNSISSIYKNENIYLGSQFVKITLRFRTKCFETSQVLQRGERVLFDKISRKIFSLSSSTYAYSLNN